MRHRQGFTVAGTPGVTGRPNRLALRGHCERIRRITQRPMNNNPSAKSRPRLFQFKTMARSIIPAILLLATAVMAMGNPLTKATKSNLSRKCGTAPSAFFVFIPFPCPSLQEYEKSEAFMDAICASATTGHFKVAIVRSCYNEGADSLRKSQNDNWWWDEIVDLPHHYNTYITGGVVSLLDAYPQVSIEYTPIGYLFKGNKVVWTGQLNAVDPKDVLNLVEKAIGRPGMCPAAVCSGKYKPVTV
jgi:hypothetical protein